MESTETTTEPSYEMPDDSEGFVLAEYAAFHMLEKKAEEVLVLDLRGRSDFCDFFVLGTGQADVQVKAIAQAVVNGLVVTGEKAHHVEGMRDGRWVLVDFVSVRNHVFKAKVRDYYQLERLWADAPQLAVSIEHFQDPDVRRRQAGRPGMVPPDRDAAGADAS